MKKFLVTLTTFVIASALTASFVLADVINQENFKTHLRWNLLVPRDQITVVKRDQTLYIETLNLQLFETLAGDLAKVKANNSYIADVSYSKDNFPARPATVSVKLKDPSVELFSFYRDADKKYILDFWINSDLVSEKAPTMTKLQPLPVEPVVVKKKVELPSKNELLAQKSKLLTAVEVKKTDETVLNPGYRDYRYGASFMWNYNAMIPSLEKDINLSSKIPEALYPVKDRVKLDDAKEAHMQLTINFFREEKWGLMNKSITLYEKKYGTRDGNYVINEYLKANALLKGNLAKPNRGITQSAMVILSNIKDLTTDYELKSSILRYLIQYHVDSKDFVRTLELSKELYVEARGNFDQTLVIQSALTILHALAELKQPEKIEAFLTESENKKLQSILPPQMSMAYLTFALLMKGETKEILKRYKLVEKSLMKPVHPAILFNVGESYFRHANYEAAIKLFDEFVSVYSYVREAPHARLRLALAYELLDRPVSETLVLYKNAIDRSTDPAIRYEAKVRYVGLRVARKIKPNADDFETEIFLEQSPDESKVLSQDLKKLLWLVRLRLFMAGKDYDKALAYLTGIPLDALKPAERRVFEGDGAEIVFGLIQEAYLKEDYAKAVKIWETYREKYEKKVASNLYLNFVICDSFLKLGMYKSYDRALATFKEVQKEEPRTFPIWVERTKSTDLGQMVEELSIIRLVADQKYTEASDKLATLPVSLRDSINYPYYVGLIKFNQKAYSDAVVEFEKVLVRQNPSNILTTRQTSELLMGYVVSLFQLKDQERFKTVVKALSDDVSSSKSAPILNISERINYLLIEAYAGEGSPEWKELEVMTKSFREKFQKSPYTARIGYLYGLSLIKNSRVQEGRGVLSDLTNDKNVPSHIKEMARSELATLELIEKKL
jgi:tetratricopeptide (TPR) repeat protein